MKGRLVVDMEASPEAPDEICEIENGRRILKAGTVLDHPQVFRLVHGGFAEAEDDECRERVAQCNPTQSGTLRKVHERIMREFQDFQDEMAAEQDEDDDE